MLVEPFLHESSCFEASDKGHIDIQQEQCNWLFERYLPWIAVVVVSGPFFLFICAEQFIEVLENVLPVGACNQFVRDA